MKFARFRRALSEIALIGGIYLAYSLVRNRFGSARVDPAEALANATTVIDIEQRLGLYFEPALQGWFIDYTAFIQFWNLYYGLFHFLITAIVVIWAFVALENSYLWWRRMLLGATVVALVGYALFPLMPPRLLATCGTYGGCVATSAEAGFDVDFVDTVTEVGGIWSFESDAVESVTNHYAAMPSLHIGWAVWVALILTRTARNVWVRRAAVVHLLATTFGILVTANHYWLDVAGGLVVVGAGAGIAHGMAKVGRLRVRRAI